MHDTHRRSGIAFARVSLGLLALGFAAPIAQAQIVYVATSGDKFGTLNLATGDFTDINSLSLVGLGFTTNGNLYGVDGNSFLHQINPATGAMTGADLVQASDGSLVFTATTSGNLVYGFTPTPPHTLFSFDPLTHAEADVPPSKDIQPDGLMAANDGTFYATGFTDDIGHPILYQITTTGQVTPVGSTGAALPFYAGVFVGNTLYGFNDDGNIYTIDTHTGAATLTHSYNLHSHGDTIFAAAVAPAAAPEPSQAATLGLGLLGLGGMVLKARKRKTGAGM